MTKIDNKPSLEGIVPSNTTDKSLETNTINKQETNNKQGTIEKPAASTAAIIDETQKALVDLMAKTTVKAMIDTDTKLSDKEADRVYVNNKKRHMLAKCKEDDSVEIYADKIYEKYFGKIWSFNYNLIPVTVKFDGSKQEFPKFIADHIMSTIHKVSNSSVSSNNVEKR